MSLGDTERKDKRTPFEVASGAIAVACGLNNSALLAEVLTMAKDAGPEYVQGAIAELTARQQKRLSIPTPRG